MLQCSASHKYDPKLCVPKGAATKKTPGDATLSGSFHVPYAELLSDIPIQHILEQLLTPRDVWSNLSLLKHVLLESLEVC